MRRPRFTRKLLALKLFDVGAFQDKSQSPGGKGFKLKLHEKNPDAPLSPFYLNLRTPDNPKPGPLTPKMVREIGNALYFKASCVEGIRYDCVAGVPRAGDPFAKALAGCFNPPIPVLRLSKSEESKSRRVVDVISGGYREGDIVLVVDDLITKADSKLEAIQALEKKGLWVRDIIVVVDRQQGGWRHLKKMGYRLHKIFNFSELLRWYTETGRITLESCNEIRAYLAAD